MNWSRWENVFFLSLICSIFIMPLITVVVYRYLGRDPLADTNWPAPVVLAIVWPLVPVLLLMKYAAPVFIWCFWDVPERLGRRRRERKGKCGIAR